MREFYTRYAVYSFGQYIRYSVFGIHNCESAAKEISPKRRRHVSAIEIVNEKSSVYIVYTHLLYIYRRVSWQRAACQLESPHVPPS